MEMEQTVSRIVRRIRPYLDGLLETKEGGALGLADDELGAPASCCTTAEAAVFYVLDHRLHGGDGHRVAAGLAKDVSRRQQTSGAFGQPYYKKHGEPETVDIAEIGAAANALFHVHRETGSEDARSALLKAAAYLEMQAARENPGAVYKNPQALQIDVLNGDMYAAHTLARAFELNGSEAYRTRVEEIFRHLIRRFGKHTPGWWPYTEQWDGSLGMGNSVSYQAIIVGFAQTAVKVLPAELASDWRKVAQTAAATMLESMAEGAHDGNEAPWWCRDWGNVWEIDYALSRFSEWPEAAAYVTRRLNELDSRLESEGIAAFRPKGIIPDPERAPVTTTFRKAATFAGILSYMALDVSEPGTGGITAWRG